MTPIQKIKHAILLLNAEWKEKELDPISENNIDDLYDELVEEDEHWDAMSEIRSTYDQETNIKCPYSSRFETKSVAKKMPDGSWIGWTYYYGGGKHSDPDAIDWIEDVYELNCYEEEKVVVVRIFEKIVKEDTELMKY